MGKKNVKQSGALVPRVSEPHEYAAPFVQFVSLLKQGEDQLVRAFGQEVWTNFPAEEIITAGLGLIIEQVAAKLGLGLESEEDVIKVARRVDRVINAGLILKYGNIGQAAAGFKKEVVDAVTCAMEYGYRPGIDITIGVWQKFINGQPDELERICRLPKPRLKSSFIQFWQKPSAIFFASLLKLVREYHQAMASRLKFLKNSNHIRNDYLKYAPKELKNKDIDFYAVSPDYLTMAQDTLDFFDINLEVSTGLSASPMRTVDDSIGRKSMLEQCQSFCRLDAKLAELEKLIRFYRRLPYGDKQAYEDLDIYSVARGVVLEEYWLETQLLLAVIDAPLERELLRYNEFGRAVTNVNRLRVNDLTKLVQKRLIDRGLKESQEGEYKGCVSKAVIKARKRKPCQSISEITGIMFEKEIFRR